MTSNQEGKLFFITFPHNRLTFSHKNITLVSDVYKRQAPAIVRARRLADVFLEPATMAPRCVRGALALVDRQRGVWGKVMVSVVIMAHLPLSPSRSHQSPVSYTHLDVYKRQLM